MAGRHAQPALRRDSQPLGTGPFSRRLEWRGLGGGRGGPWTAPHRYRRWWVDPYSGFVRWHLRVQGVVGPHPGLPGERDVESVAHRPDDPHGRRRGADAGGELAGRRTRTVLAARPTRRGEQNVARV